MPRIGVVADGVEIGFLVVGPEHTPAQIEQARRHVVRTAAQKARDRARREGKGDTEDAVIAAKETERIAGAAILVNDTKGDR